MKEYKFYYRIILSPGQYDPRENDVQLKAF